MAQVSEFLANFGSSPWGPMALAFLFGVVFGWLVWGAGPEDEIAARTAFADAEKPKELIVLKAEIDAARSILDETEEAEAALAANLETLDKAVGGASERLKSVTAAVKHAAKNAALHR